MLAVVLSIPLIMHALANLAGVLAPWIKSPMGFADVSWLFSGGITYLSGAGRAFSLIWLASSVCLVAAGVGLLTRQSWWLPVSILGCAISAIAILPWWKAVPPGARFGAIFDVIAIVLLVSPVGKPIVEAVR